MISCYASVDCIAYTWDDVWADIPTTIELCIHACHDNIDERNKNAQIKVNIKDNKA